jgi:hypothetical protein
MTSPIIVHADLNYVGCGSAEGIPEPLVQMTRMIYTFLVVITPLVLMAFSIITMVKALKEQNADEVIKAKDKLVKKFVAAGIILLLGAITRFVMIQVVSNDSDKNTFLSCTKCFLFNADCHESDTGNDVKRGFYHTEPDSDFINDTQSNRSNYKPSNTSPSSTTSNTPSTPTSNTPTGGSTYTNTKNKIVYKLYNQASSPWGSLTYSDGKTVAYRGCMITSSAVIASAGDSSVTPETVYNKYLHTNPSSAIPSLSGNNFTCSFGNTSKSSIQSYLNDGKVVVVKVWGRSNGGSSSFTSSQHYMALLDISSDNNQVYVGNSHGSASGKSASAWFSIDDVLVSIKTAEVCTPTQALIDKYK